VTAPSITVELYIPGTGWKYVSAATSLDTAIEPTEAIENPTETNAFVAADVTLKLYSDNGVTFQFSDFSGMLPESTDYLVRIQRNGVNLFYGFVLPNTLQFDDAERWASFTAVGMAGKLARTSADSDPFLKRIVQTTWRVHEAGGSGSQGTIIIYNTFGPQSQCEIESGDTITVETPGGRKDDITVLGIAPTTDTAPFAYFELTVEGMTQAYEPGSVVTLITPYVRNISIKHLIDRLFIHSGLAGTSTSTFLASPLSGATAPFATPPNMQGVAGLGSLGVAPWVNPIISSERPGDHPLCGTMLGVWQQLAPPTGDWTFYDHIDKALTPVDWRPYGSGKWLQYGLRYKRTLVRSGAPDPFVSGAIYSFWCYDYFSTFAPATYTRWRLDVEVDNFDRSSLVYNWTTNLYKETSTDGWQWTTVGGPYGTKTGATAADLHYEVPLSCGIDMLRVLGVATRIYFTEPDDTVDPCQWYVSEMTTAGSVTRNVGPAGYSVRGNVFTFTPGVLGIFRRDTERTDIPMLFTLENPGFGLALSTTAPIPADLQPWTLKYNEGDTYYYALSASRENGVKLLSFVGTGLAVRSGWTPPQLLAPSNSLGRIDMCVINGMPGTTYPMLAIFGNQLWWISRSASGWIEYADLEGLSCGEAIAQLVTLLDAYAYVDRDMVSWVKSRSTASPRTIATGTSATSTRIDDAGCISFRRSSVYYKSYRFVRVVNERDEAIFGEAGDTSFRDTEQALELSSRFVSTSSFAVGLAENMLSYLGRPLVSVDVEHELDERRYEIGRTFTASINGVVKSFQLIEATPRPLAGTVRVLGLEL